MRGFIYQLQSKGCNIARWILGLLFVLFFYTSISCAGLVDETVDKLFGFKDNCRSAAHPVDWLSFNSAISYYRCHSDGLVVGHPEDWFATETIPLSLNNLHSLQVVVDSQQKFLESEEDLIWIRQAIRERNDDVALAKKTFDGAVETLNCEESFQTVSHGKQPHCQIDLVWEPTFQRIERNAVQVDAINQVIRENLKRNACGGNYSKNIDTNWGVCFSQKNENRDDPKFKETLALFELRDMLLTQTPILKTNPELVTWAGEALNPGTHSDTPLLKFIPHHSSADSFSFRKDFRAELKAVLDKTSKGFDKRLVHYRDVLEKGKNVGNQEEYGKYYQEVMDDEDLLEELTASTNPIKRKDLAEPLFRAHCRIQEQVYAQKAASEVKNFAVNTALTALPLVGYLGKAGLVANAALVARGTNTIAILGGLGISIHDLTSKSARCASLQNQATEKAVTSNDSADINKVNTDSIECGREFGDQVLLASLAAIPALKQLYDEGKLVYPVIKKSLAANIHPPTKPPVGSVGKAGIAQDEALTLTNTEEAPPSSSESTLPRPEGEPNPSQAATSSAVDQVAHAFPESKVWSSLEKIQETLSPDRAAKFGQGVQNFKKVVSALPTEDGQRLLASVEAWPDETKLLFMEDMKGFKTDPHTIKGARFNFTDPASGKTGETIVSPSRQYNPGDELKKKIGNVDDTLASLKAPMEPDQDWRRIVTTPTQAM